MIHAEAVWVGILCGSVAAAVAAFIVIRERGERREFALLVDALGAEGGGRWAVGTQDGVIYRLKRRGRGRTRRLEVLLPGRSSRRFSIRPAHASGAEAQKRGLRLADDDVRQGVAVDSPSPGFVDDLLAQPHVARSVSRLLEMRAGDIVLRRGRLAACWDPAPPFSEVDPRTVSTAVAYLHGIARRIEGFLEPPAVSRVARAEGRRRWMVGIPRLALLIGLALGATAAWTFPPFDPGETLAAAAPAAAVAWLVFAIVSLALLRGVPGLWRARIRSLALALVGFPLAAAALFAASAWIPHRDAGIYTARVATDHRFPGGLPAAYLLHIAVDRGGERWVLVRSPPPYTSWRGRIGISTRRTILGYEWIAAVRPLKASPPRHEDTKKKDSRLGSRQAHPGSFVGLSPRVSAPFRGEDEGGGLLSGRRV